MRAALIYQHANDDRQQQIAEAMDAKIIEGLQRRPEKSANPCEIDSRWHGDGTAGE